MDVSVMSSGKTDPVTSTLYYKGFQIEEKIHKAKNAFIIDRILRKSKYEKHNYRIQLMLVKLIAYHDIIYIQRYLILTYNNQIIEVH